MFFIWFCAFTCSRTWLKTYAKRRTNSSLLSRDKKISFLLELFYQVLSISEYVYRSISWFRFWLKIYIKRCTNKSVLSRVKTFFACTLDLIYFKTWLGNGRILCKQKYWIKNMAVKNPIFILAFVYFANFLLSLL